MRQAIARSVLLACLGAASSLPGSVRAQSSIAGDNDLPQYEVRDPTAAVITSGNLIESERFWPYRVSLMKGFQAAGTEQGVVKVGDIGVLIRVETPEIARIDFGRGGIHELPVSKTDLIEQANRIRRGDALKKAPNFTLALGPRLISSDTTSMAPLRLRKTLEYRGFLTVFADPDAVDFPKIAASLAPLREWQGVLTVLLPVSKRSDREIYERLQGLKWPVAFVYDHLNESYLASLLPGGGKPPFVMLQTREGRVLFQAGWSPDVAKDLRAVLDPSLPKAPAAPPPISQDASAEGAASPGANQSGDDSKP